MEYGKFNSADELLKGYNELEKSFTQKCQQLSALEKQISASGTSEVSPPQETDDMQSAAADAVDTAPTPSDADSPSEVNQSASELPIEQIKQYLAEHPEVLSSLFDKAQTVAPPKVMTSGGNVSMALPNRPKTIKEASELAKKYFK